MIIDRRYPRWKMHCRRSSDMRDMRGGYSTRDATRVVHRERMRTLIVNYYAHDARASRSARALHSDSCFTTGSAHAPVPFAVVPCRTHARRLPTTRTPVTDSAQAAVQARLVAERYTIRAIQQTRASSLSTGTYPLPTRVLASAANGGEDIYLLLRLPRLQMSSLTPLSPLKRKFSLPSACSALSLLFKFLQLRRSPASRQVSGPPSTNPDVRFSKSPITYSM
jgi:hypothetical protein